MVGWLKASLVATLFSCMFKSCPGIVNEKASTNLDRAQSTGQSLTKTVESMTESSTLSKLLSASRDKKEAKALISEAKAKVSTIASETKAKLLDKDEGVVERVTDSINGVMDGLVGMVSGIKNGDWVEGLQGALGIASSMAALAGPGIGTIISGVLSAISTFISLFGGSEEESQESMVKRVVEAAIKEFRNKDMKEDVEGLQHVYQSISISIQQFRESGKLTQSQAEEFYTSAFEELSVFGRLKTRIGELCEKPKDVSAAKDCVDFIKLYADLSILRQLIITDMASLMAEPTIDLLGTSENIMHVIRKEQENDLNLLQFLGDPASNPGKRLVIAAMFGYPESYEVLISYLNNLHKLFGGLWRKDLVICTEKMLAGECVAIRYEEKGNYPKLNDLYMDNKLLSFFVPMQGKVSFWPDENYSGSMKGPYIGPALHGYSGTATHSSLKYEETDETNQGSVRFCESNALDPTALCDYWALNKDAKGETTIDLNNYHGIPWTKKIGSFYVPAKRVLYGIGDGQKKYGPFFGPNNVDKVCGSAAKAEWIKVTLKKVKWDARNMVKLFDTEGMKGSCFHASEKISDLTKVMQQCNFESKVKSVKIPGGFEVSGYFAKSLSIRFAGPYRGPVTIDRVDWPAKWKSVNITGQTEEDKEQEKASTASSSEVHREAKKHFSVSHLKSSSRLNTRLEKHSFGKHRVPVAVRRHGDAAEGYEFESDA